MSQAHAHIRVGVRQWLTTSLGRAYSRRFVLLWIAGKIANAATATKVGLPPLGFRFGTELVICAFELGALVVIIRRANEHTLLGNLGLSFPQVLAPLVVLHFILSIVVALLA